ncbi:MAG: germination protein YpeB [Desulfotomaculaceae bacterium]
MRKWIILSVVASLLVVAATGTWGYSQRQANRDLENYLNNKYQRAFYDMTGQVQNLEVLLSKSMVATDPRLDSSLFMDIRQQAAFAQSNLGQLPLNDALAGRTAKFLTQVGDYAGSLASQVNKGEAIDSQNWDTLNSLYQQSMELNRELQGMQYNIAQNNFYFGELVRQVRKNLQKNPDNLAVTDFQALDKRMQQYPSLIYDGPFSEHLERTDPRDLSGLADVSPDEAQNRALSYIDRKPGVEYSAAVTGTAQGRIPAYRVEVTPGGDSADTTVLDISKKGGKLIWALNSRPVTNQALDINAARQKALKYLKDHGFGDMNATYFTLHGNSATFNFAAAQNNIVIYPDLVKVTVALDNGEITGAETSGYLMSHRTRDLPRAKITPEHARGSINPRLQVSGGGKLVLIPVGVDDEKLAYEFQGKLGEDTYLVYINADDGREENVLKLIETPGGTLTM